jgi:UDP-GlcNAc:undecaprenyl-phosphate/decaprenyl-phosphate GlcNAc-1-phosphate transferase
MLTALAILGVEEALEVPFTRDLQAPATSAQHAIGELSFLDVAPGYASVLITAFLVTLIATPIMRRLALANGIIDHPSDDRKIHRKPVAYMGGVAVFLGLMAGILLSYFAAAGMNVIQFHPSLQRLEGISDLAVPPSIILGMFVIMMVGLLDDILHISPRIKVAGQLIAAAALAVNEVAVRVAAGVILPIAERFGIEARHVLSAVDPSRAADLLNDPTLADPAVTDRFSDTFIATTVVSPFESIYWNIPLPTDMPFLGTHIHFDLIYWVSTAVIAIFVLGACNASNLIDGLDGLLSGVTAIAAGGLTAIAIMFAMADADPQNTQQIVLGLAILGACLGFLPYNFKPASIFLGDCGSLLLGFSLIALVLMMSGKSGHHTHIIVAGLIIYCIPIMDTILAIVRRKMTGKSMSEPDDEHLHHMLQRRLGVRRAVLTLYGIGLVAAVVGVLLARYASAVPMYAAGTLLFGILLTTAFMIGLKKRHKAAARLAAGIDPADDSGAISGLASADLHPEDSSPQVATRR